MYSHYGKVHTSLAMLINSVELETRKASHRHCIDKWKTGKNVDLPFWGSVEKFYKTWQHFMDGVEPRHLISSQHLSICAKGCEV